MQTPPAKRARDLLLLRELSTGRVQTLKTLVPRAWPLGALVQRKCPLPAAVLWRPDPEQAEQGSSPGGQAGRMVPSETP